MADDSLRWFPSTLDDWPCGVWMTPMVIVALYGTLLALCSDASLPTTDAPWQLWPYLSVQPVGEDAFYYLSTAWNLAAGEGLTVHGRTSVTGIQPLFPLLLAIPAKCIQWLGGTKWHLIRVVILIQTINFCLFSLLVARLAEVISPRIGTSSATHAWHGALATLLLTLGSFSLFRLFAYGLETGLYLTFIVLSMLVSFRLGGASDGANEAGTEDSSVWLPLKAGVIFGVTGLIRIDFGVALGVFLAVGLVAGWFRLRDALVSGGTAAALVAPWLGYVYDHMGTIIPSSGVAESNYIRSEDVGRRLLSMIQAFMEMLTPIYFVRLGGIIADIGGFVALAVVGLVAWRLRDNLQGLLNRRALGWLVAFVVLSSVYLAVFRSAWFYHRYVSPLYLFALPILGVVVVDLGSMWVGRDGLDRLHAPIVCVLMLQFFVWAGLVLHRDTAVTAQQLPHYVNHAIGARAVADHLPGDRGTLGAFQSGTIGYFHDDVVNLDGKVNNDVLPYLAERRVCDYLDELGVEYVVDWKTIVDYHMPDECLRTRWERCGPAFPGPYICRRRTTGRR